MHNKSWIKYVIGLLICIIIRRFVPMPIPNIEPIMFTMMPFAKKYGKMAGFIFAFSAIIAIDFITGIVGIWTAVTSITYGAIGIFAAQYLYQKKNKTKYYVGFAILGTLAYDAITGIGMGTLLFGQTLQFTILGQIPFTIYHLIGNVSFAALFSGLIYKFIVANPKLDTDVVYDKIKTKFSHRI
ncbi:hypothetical protein HN924_02620 [Candidatus Woesearchaeota archaeon]|jgi:hypothetical protein|nr:hypothetical protein [Candidatus Woesearchaeota archaeon]MBT7062837.1 hypothetical protein [Candidatus Woesearchaeota archaeon]MBT7403002.1 hypothetical protein [Candidatus Woesearchaeota archaeon]